MNNAIVDKLLALPLADRFLEDVFRNLTDGNSVIVVIPPGLDVDRVWMHLHNKLWEHEYSSVEIDVDQIESVPCSRVSCEEIITTTLGLEPQVQDNSGIVLDRKFPNVIRFKGLSGLDNVRKKHWVQINDIWRRLTAISTDRYVGPHVYCIIETAGTLLDVLPDSDVNLCIRWWWSMPSSTEIRLLCQSFPGDDYVFNNWRECLVSGLAGGDLVFAAYLLENTPLNLNDLHGNIREYAGKNMPDVRSIDKNIHLEFFDRYDIDTKPPSHLRSAWAQGCVIACPEFGIDLHPAFLMLLGKTQSIENLVWRGQLSFLMPRTNYIRVWAGSQLTHDKGRDWYTKTEAPPDDEVKIKLEADPRDAELGYLYIAVKEFRYSKLRYPVKLARDIRNDIAHYCPVNYEQFKELMNCTNQLS